jgi:hypothetical protein
MDEGTREEMTEIGSRLQLRQSLRLSDLLNDGKEGLSLRAWESDCGF